MRTSTSHHLLGTAAGLLLVVAAATGCGSDATDHAGTMGQRMGRAMGHAASQGAGERTYFAQYGADTHAYKPVRLNPSVDGSLYVTGMRWTRWTDREAVGEGVAHVNDCTPDCADGHYTKHRVTVRLAQPQEMCGSRFFTSIRMTGPSYQTYARHRGVGCR